MRIFIIIWWRAWGLPCSLLTCNDHMMHVHPRWAWRVCTQRRGRCPDMTLNSFPNVLPSTDSWETRKVHPLLRLLAPPVRKCMFELKHSDRGKSALCDVTRGSRFSPYCYIFINGLCTLRVGAATNPLAGPLLPRMHCGASRPLD